MNKTCKVCGHTGENVWRDNKYYCAACGSEIDVTQPDPPQVSASPDQNAVILNIPCPVCKNAANNTIKDGKCRCSLCGTTFNPQVVSQPAYQNSAIQTTNPNNARIQELEKEKSSRLTWGIVFLFLFWPVSVYHFYKMYQISQEIASLKG